MSVSLRETYA